MRERAPRREKTFAGLVSYDTILEGGFNYWEPSYFIEVNGCLGTVYDAHVPHSDLHLIVIRVPRRGRKIPIWYFGTIRGEPLRNLSNEGVEEYLGQVGKIVSDEKNKVVPPTDLERLILKAVQQGTSD